MKNLTLLFFLTLFVTNIFSQSIEEEINKFAGVFAGEWTTYKLDENHKSIKSLSWKDTLRTGKPIINDSLAFVDIKSVMIFDNPRIPPYKMSFKEGLKIKDGNIQSHFFTAMGQETLETKIGENTYIVSQDISPFELKQLGINSAIYANNTTVKIILKENGIEVHKITRISTITIIEESKEKMIQFTSLSGYHKRINN